MLPKSHLTSHSRMFGYRWVMTHSWLPGSCRSFLYISSVYFCHLFLISSVGFIPFLSFIVLIFAWKMVSLIFLKRSLVFPILLVSLFLCSDHSGSLSYRSLRFFGTLHSNGNIFPFLLCLSLLFFSQLFVRPPQTTICLFAFLFVGDGLAPCLLYNVTNLHPSSSGLCLSDLIPWIYCHFHCIIIRDLIWVIPEQSNGFPYFNLSMNVGFPGSSDGKASTCNAGDLGLIPGSGRSPGGGNGNPLQYSCLENSMDGGAW